MRSFKLLPLIALLALGACGDIWMTEDQKAATKATQEVVNERVAAGTMTPAEGRMILANQRAQYSDIASQRVISASASRPVTYQPVGGGTVIRY